MNVTKNSASVIPLTLVFKGRTYRGKAIPIAHSCTPEVCFKLEVSLNNKNLGTIYCEKDLRWKMDENIPQEFVDEIGEEIQLWYE